MGRVSFVKKSSIPSVSNPSKLSSAERKSRSRATARRDAVGYAFITPWLIGFLCFSLGPVLASLYLSFTKFDLLTPAVWVGTDNYMRMFTEDPRFYQALKVTFTYMIFEVPLKLAFALAIAMVPAFLGLFIALPVLGHATWHLYRRVVG